MTGTASATGAWFRKETAAKLLRSRSADASFSAWRTAPVDCPGGDKTGKMFTSATNAAPGGLSLDALETLL